LRGEAVNADDLQAELSTLRSLLAEVTCERDAALAIIENVRSWATTCAEWGGGEHPLGSVAGAAFAQAFNVAGKEVLGLLPGRENKSC